MNPYGSIKTTGCMYCGDAGAVGHSPSTTEVLHNMPLSIHRHAGYKKNRACDPFQRRERKAKGRCEIFSCLFFTFASHALHQAFFICFRGIFILFYRLPSFHIKQSQGHGAGCRWHTACQLHLCLMDGGLKQKPSSSHFLSISAAPCHVLPRSEDF